MTRAKSWTLALCIALLALGVSWLVPGLLRDRAPEPGRAVEGSVETGSATESLSAGQDPGAPESESTIAAAVPEAARSAPSSREVDDAEDHPPPTSSLAGRLVDRTGRPVAGATVLAAHAPEFGAPIVRSDGWITHLPLDVADSVALGAEVPIHTTSDRAGRFELEGIDPGRVRIAVRSVKLAPLDRNDLRLAAGERQLLGDLLLEPPAQIFGQLEDGVGHGVSGAPIVEIDAFTEAWLPPLKPDVGVRLADTDLRGAFQSRPLIVGPWDARALGGELFVDAAMRGSSPAQGWNLRETMEEAGWLHGMLATRGPFAENLFVRAVPADTARSPVPFACRADGRSGRVQRNGAFEIDGIAPGVLYELRAGAANQRFEDESLWSPPMFAAASDEEVRVPWEADATVTFALVDATERSSVTTCEVELEGALPARAVLGAPAPGRGGLRVLEGVRPLRPFSGPSLRAASRGFLPLVQRLDLRPGHDAPLGSLAMSPIPQLDVRVVDAVTGARLEGAFVTATDVLLGEDPSGLAPAAVTTDSAGEARVRSFVGADSQIEVRARGYARQRRVGPFGGGFSIPRVEFRMARGATASIRVVDAAGLPISGARVEWIEGSWSPNDASARGDPHHVLDRLEPETSRIADSQGIAVFHHLAPGRHAFRVERWEVPLDGEWTQRELVEGEAADIELQGLARTSLDVRITDTGAPLVGAPVVLLRRSSVNSLLGVAELENPLPPGLDARTDSAGAHSFANLDPGVYVLAFAVPGQRSRGCREVRVRDGTNLLALDLASTAISGRVRMGESRLVAGARILLADSTRDRDLRETIRRGGSAVAASSDLYRSGLDHEATVADEHGEFRLLGLPIGEPFVILAIEDPCGSGRTEPLVLRQDSGPTDAEVTLHPGGALAIRATNTRLIAPVILFGIPKDRRAVSRICRIFPGRTESLNGLEPGPWELQLGDGSSRSNDRQHVDVVAGETLRVDWSLP